MEGFTLMTVDVRVQVQGLGVLVTLETVVVIPQYKVREVGSAWRMWMRHSRQDVGRIVTLDTVDMYPHIQGLGRWSQ